MSAVAVVTGRWLRMAPRVYPGVFLSGQVARGGQVLPSNRPLHRALYLQVRDALADRIANGTWKPGTPVANEGDLARELGVSAGTVRKALELMEEQRLISRRQGRGTFVSDQTSGEPAARFCNIRGPGGERLMGRVVSVEINEGTADDQERRHLRLADGEAVYRIRRVWCHGGQNYLVANLTVPAALFPGLVNRREVASTINSLAQGYGILLGKQEIRVSMGLLPAGIAEALGVAVGTPALQLQRLVFMLDGSPVEWGTAYNHLPGSFFMAEMA
jgi:GntR family transcriptional regulator